MAKKLPLISDAANVVQADENPFGAAVPGPAEGEAGGETPAQPEEGGAAVGLDLDGIVAKIQAAQNEGKTVKVITAQAAAEAVKSAVDGMLSALGVPGLEIIPAAEDQMEVLSIGPGIEPPAAEAAPGLQTGTGG